MKKNLTPCPKCRKWREPMRTDPTRCGICQSTLTPPAAAARPAVETETLFSGPAPYVAHSATSKAAAESVRGLNEKRAAVLGYLVHVGPATDNELIAVFCERGWSPNTPRARRVDLKDAGYAEDSGERSQNCALWRATDEGRAALAEWDARKAAA